MAPTCSVDLINVRIMQSLMVNCHEIYYQSTDDDVLEPILVRIDTLFIPSNHSQGRWNLTSSGFRLILI